MIAPLRPAGVTASQMVELFARLRMACAAVGPNGIRPTDVNLDDLAPVQRQRFMSDATEDFWSFIGTPVDSGTLEK